MRLRNSALPLAFAALIASFFIASPAEAAGKFKITGTVIGPSSAHVRPTNLKVTVWKVQKGRGTPVTASQPIAGVGGKFSFKVPRSKTAKYVLSISGYDQNGAYRSWYWRGPKSLASGGKYLREATRISGKTKGKFVAPFRYGVASGTARNSHGKPVANAEITVAQVPAAFPKKTIKQRELDIDNCANILGETRTNAHGQYQVTFLPAPNTRSYATEIRSGKHRIWNNRFGSCQHATKYKHSSDALKALSSFAGSGARAVGPAIQQDFEVRDIRGKINVNATFRGFKPTVLGDRFASLREFIPGKTIATSPIIAVGTVSAAGKHSFSGVAPGRYWLEIGRRTSCQSWIPSRFPDNKQYLKGRDRGSERWKTVSGSKAELKRSIKHGFPKSGRKPPKGMKGWMYRDYCQSLGTGSYQRVTVGVGKTVKVSPTISRGATIKGRVSRTDGRSNQEILVSAYSTQGTLVMRTAITNGSGNFKITGLASGNYRLGVNSDSWRGIARTFYGVHTKRVKASGGYSVGHLRLGADKKLNERDD